MNCPANAGLFFLSDRFKCILLSMKEAQTFSQKCKEEISKVDFPDSVLRSLLSSFCKINGVLHKSKGKEELDLSSDSSSVAKFLYLSFHDIYGIDPRFAYTKSTGFRKGTKFHVLCPEASYILDDLHVDFLSSRLPKGLTDSEGEAAAYLSGAFLAAGSVSTPLSSNYHLEMAFADQTYAKWISHLIARANGHPFSPKVIQRRNRYVVYLKKAEEISDFLAYIGAPNSRLEFENIRIDRDFSNIGNRLSNLDAANFSKTMASSQRQVKEIEYFVGKKGWDGIRNLKLRYLMKLRLDRPDASLEELADALSDELASTVTKSNVNHLFRKLHQEYLEEKGDE